MLVKKVAGAINLLEGLWMIYLVFYATRISMFCPATGCPALSIGVPLISVFSVGVLLVVDSAICFVERWFAFPVGGLLSAITIVLVLLQWGTLGTSYVAVSMIFSAVALTLDVKAAISQSRLSEQEHPLNLPVFG